MEMVGLFRSIIYNVDLQNMNKVISLLLAFLVTLSYTQTASNLYKLILHSKQRGAACLDGSPAGMYINEGTGQNKTKFLIYFNGGGFCGGKTLSETLQSCYQRSKTNLGTTTVFSPEKSFDGNGALSTKQSENPHFYDWTKVFVIYCDGASHQGYRQNPIQYKDSQLHFRGTRNVLELFNYMDVNYDFYNGDSIVVTGVSAGGMAVYQWSNYILYNTKKAKVYSIPDSGMFITDYYSPIVGERVVADRIQSLIRLVSSESQMQLPDPIRQCLQSQQYSGDYVSCFDSSNYAQYLKAPMLVIQSPYDEWCLNNILIVKCLQNTRAPYSLSRCNDTTMAAIDAYRVQAIKQLNRMKNDRTNVGAWGPACVQHGYISYSSLTSSSFRIPSDTGLTLNDVIGIFLKNPEQTPWLIEDLTWPNNKGCSGQVGNLRYKQMYYM